MEVSAAVRRMRLAFVASVFLAPLLGVSPTAVEPAPAAAPPVVATHSTPVSPAAEPQAAKPETAEPVVVIRDTPVPTAPAAAPAVLGDQAARAQRAPRAPPLV
jgi:hypothetical protein